MCTGKGKALEKGDKLLDEIWEMAVQLSVYIVIGSSDSNPEHVDYCLFISAYKLG